MTPAKSSGWAAARLADIGFILSLAGALVACSVLRSRDFPMWLDEIMAYNHVTAGSTTHMLTALGDQGDAGGPLYYLLARAWAAVFSQSEMSLRLFTAAGFVAGVALLWVTLRRYFERWPTALALAAIIAASGVIKFELSNVRFYGLLFATISLACFTAARLDASTGRPGLGLLAANAVAIGALILSHPLGVIYAGMIFLAVASAKIIDRRWHDLPAVCMTYVAGLLFLLLWLRQYIRAADISRPTSWVPVPQFIALFSSVSNSWGVRWLVLAVIVIWLIERARRRRAEPAAVTAAAPSAFPLTLALALCCIDAVFWVISVTVSSIYLERYMVGVSIGLIFALAELLRRALPQAPFTTLTRVALVLAFVACLGEIGRRAPRPTRAFQAGNFDDAFGYADLPIVCSSLHSFAPRVQYSPRRERYFFLTGAEFAKANPVEFKMAAALSKYFPERYPNIVDYAQFVATHPRFVALIQFTDPSEWYRRDGYELTPLPTEPLPNGERLFLVQRAATSQDAEIVR